MVMLEGHAMVWKVAEAKKMFSDMIHRVREEPQVICNRSTVVAVVIDPAQYEEYKSLKEARGKDTLGLAFGELRAICEEESYDIAVPDRADRESSWPQ